MEKKRSVGAIFILTLLIFCLLPPVFASEVTFRELSDVVPKAKVILKGKVDSFEKEIIKDVKEEYFYAISVEEVLLGNVEQGKIKARYALIYPYIRDKQDKITGWLSPILDASGLESSVQQDNSYLFFFSSDINGQGSDNELIRIESVDKKGKVAKLLKENSQPLQLTIESDKEVYEVGEDIFVELTLRNNSNRELYLDHFYKDIDSIGTRSNFRFKVLKDKSKIEQQYLHGEVIKRLIVPFKRTQIKAGGEIIFKATLNKWYSMTEAGKYSVVCMYSSKGPFPMNEWMPMWEGAVTSNTITIEVVEKREKETKEYDLKVFHEINMNYRIEVITKSDKRVIQTINFRNGVNPTKQDSSKMVDFDRDGFLDIVVLGGETEQGKWYKIWRYDPTVEKFIWLRTTEPGERF